MKAAPLPPTPGNQSRRFPPPWTAGPPSATGGFRAAFIAVSSGISRPMSIGDINPFLIPFEILKYYGFEGIDLCAFLPGVLGKPGF